MKAAAGIMAVVLMALSLFWFSYDKQHRELHRRINASAEVGRLRTISLVEREYATENPTVGYTCNLKDLGARDVAINESYTGYRLTFMDCPPPPRRSYRLVAEPAETGESGDRTFCMDESGVILASSDSNGERTCKSGRALE